MKIDQIFKRCLEISMKKRQDYTTNPNVNHHENFERSAELVSWFKHDIDKPYAVLIGTKLARLATLLSTDHAPNYEPIEDTFIDLTNYCALWAERRILEIPIPKNDNQISIPKGLLNSPPVTETHKYTQTRQPNIMTPPSNQIPTELEYLQKRSKGAASQIINLSAELTTDDLRMVRDWFVAATWDIG